MTENMLIEWAQAQSCGECGADAAYLRHEATGSAICRECSHEHPMSPWTLDEGEGYTWHTLAAGSVAMVLHVTAYTALGQALRAEGRVSA